MDRPSLAVHLAFCVLGCPAPECSCQRLEPLPKAQRMLAHQGICLRVVAYDAADLGRRPDKELALLAFAIGILGAVEPTSRVGHFPNDIVEDLFRDGAEELIARDLLGVDA